jgi:hypothetical protein
LRYAALQAVSLWGFCGVQKPPAALCVAIRSFTSSLGAVVSFGLSSPTITTAMAPRPLALLLSLLALAATAVATTTGYGTAYGGESLQDRMWRRLLLLGSPAAGCGGQLASCLLALDGC